MFIHMYLYARAPHLYAIKHRRSVAHINTYTIRQQYATPGTLLCIQTGAHKEKHKLDRWGGNWRHIHSNRQGKKKYINHISSVGRN